jgi:hypothetical protein
VTVTPQLKAIVLAGVLAVLGAAGAFMTLTMNQAGASDNVPATITPLKERRAAATLTPAKAASANPAVKPKAKLKAKPKPKPNPNVVAARKKGLPLSVARALGKSKVAVIELYSKSDPVDGIALAEAQSGAKLAGAAFVSIDVDKDGDPAALTKVLGSLPPAPAALVYVRPGILFLTMPGFNDRTTVQQASQNAAVPGAAEQAEAAAQAAAAAAAAAQAAAAAAAAAPPTTPAATPETPTP